MFFRLFFLIFLLQSFVFATSSQHVEILAKILNKQGNVVHAKDDVVLYSNKYIITADEAYYDCANDKCYDAKEVLLKVA